MKGLLSSVKRRMSSRDVPNGDSPPSTSLGVAHTGLESEVSPSRDTRKFQPRERARERSPITVETK